MERNEARRKLYEMADHQLLGAGVWPADKMTVADFSNALKAMGLEEEVSAETGCTRSTALGEELDLDLMLVFLGLFDVLDAIHILLEEGFLTDPEAQAIWALSSEQRIEDAMRPHVRQAYLKYCGRSRLRVI